MTPQSRLKKSKDPAQRRSILSSLPDDRTPEYVGKLLSEFLRMRAIALDLRRQDSLAGTLTVAQRLAFANVLETIDGWIYDSREWFARRGLTCPKQVTP